MGKGLIMIMREEGGGGSIYINLSMDKKLHSGLKFF